MVREFSSPHGSRAVLLSIAGAFLVGAAATILIWFAWSGVPDLWVVLSAWLQPR